MEQKFFYNNKYSGKDVYTRTGKYWNSLRAKLREGSPLSEYKERFVLDKLDDISTKRVLEIGSGGGTFATWFCAGRSKEYYTIDISDKSVRLLNKTFRSRNIQNATALCGDASNTQFETEYFDIIIGFGVLHHFDSLTKGLLEIHRILASGGQAIFYEPLNVNPIIRFLRIATSRFRPNLEWEHPFSWKEIHTVKNVFDSIHITFFDGFSSAALFFRFVPFFRKYFSTMCMKLNNLDAKIQHGGYLNNLFLTCILVIQKPN